MKEGRRKEGREDVLHSEQVALRHMLSLGNWSLNFYLKCDVVKEGSGVRGLRGGGNIDMTRGTCH